MDGTLCVINSLPALKNLEFTGNPICQENFYVAKILEATTENKLLVLDMKELNADDYQIVGSTAVVSALGNQTPEPLTDRVQQIYQHRQQALQRARPGGRGEAANDPAVDLILQEAAGELSREMDAMVRYVQEVSACAGAEQSAGQGGSAAGMQR